MKSDVYTATSLIDPDKLPRNNHRNLKAPRKAIEATEPKMRRKRKSDDIGDDSPDDCNSVPDFVRSDSITKPVILNSRDAFFDKNHTFTSLLTDSPAESYIESKECLIVTSKSFCDDENCEYREGRYRYSPRRSPTNFRRELQTKPLNNIAYGGTPCGVVDELFTGFYGCMPSWECSLPWTEDDSDDSDDDLNHRYGIVRSDAARHDPKAMREHLSFPKLGKEYVSQSQQASSPERKNRTFNRTIRRSPSSRITTLESDSRQRMPGSKMIRRTEINQVTEIHWDEEVLDMKSLEQMAKLSIY